MRRECHRACSTTSMARGSGAGEALIGHKETAGVTFTGSYDVGMRISRRMAAGAWPRPCIAEMGGKNAVIVTAGADLSRATLGIIRSAFGMGGQKCSALSRIYVDERVADDLSQRLVSEMGRLKIGDPTQRENWLGPVVNETAWRNYARYSAELRDGGARILAGGAQAHRRRAGCGLLLRADAGGGAAHAHTLATRDVRARLPCWHAWRTATLRWRSPMPVRSGSLRGSTAIRREVSWFFDNIEAGVTYANRPQGATTGAWPGYQPFGGWKGSGHHRQGHRVRLLSRALSARTVTDARRMNGRQLPMNVQADITRPALPGSEGAGTHRARRQGRLAELRARLSVRHQSWPRRRSLGR